MTIYKTDSDIHSLVQAFEERTLPKSDWTHAAHLTVALYYCSLHPFGTARNLMRDGIHWLNDSHGTPNTDDSGYHETLTVFWLRTVCEFLDESRGQMDLYLLANKLVTAFEDSKLPFKYYSRELLFSTFARYNYVEPDLRLPSRDLAKMVF